MSYTETHVGKLRKIETGPNIEHWCQSYCNSKGFHELASYIDDWIEQFSEEFGKKFLVTKDAVYEIFDHIGTDEEGIEHMQENPDGTYTFVMQFDNGGTCLSECLEEGIEKINKNKI